MEQTESQPGRLGLRARGVERTRNNILAAARQHLIDAGYRNLSLEQVAADADVTRVTIYRKFGNKLGLLDAVAENLSQRAGLIEGMRAATEIADPVAAFRGMVGELCRFWSIDPDLFRRLISLSAVDPEANRVISSRDQWRFDQVAQFVTRLADAGRVRGPFDAGTAAVAVGTITSFPTCDELATRLRRKHDELGDLLLPMLDGVVRLGGSRR